MRSELGKEGEEIETEKGKELEKGEERGRERDMERARR